MPIPRRTFLGLRSLALCSSIGLIFTPQALAENSAPPLNDRSLYQSAQQELNELETQIRQQRLSKQKYQATAAEVDTHAYSQTCLPFDEIELRGITLIPTEPLLPPLGECINEGYLNQLSKNVTAAYLKAGYLHNPFQFQSDGSRRLIMQVVEGKLAKISGEDQIINAEMLFPHLIGKPLNVRDLDQGLDQTNTLLGSTVTVDVYPDSQGNIELALQNTYRQRLSGRLSVDNYGNKSTGEWIGRGYVNIDSPFGLSDSLSLSGSHSLRSGFYPYNRSVALYYSVPYGYWRFSTFGSISQYKADLALNRTTLPQHGRTWQWGGRVENVFHRGTNSISTAYVQFDHINAQNGLADVIYEIQSPTITSGTIGLNHLQLRENGLILTDMSYEYGKPSYRNNLERFYKPYHKFNVSLDYIQYRHFFGQDFRQHHRLQGQYSRQFLPSLKQQDLLDRYNVRGFRHFSSSTEKALSLQNTLFWVKQWENWQIEPYVGIDMGIQRNVSTNHAQEYTPSHSTKAISGVIGLQLQLKNRYKLNFEWAKGKHFASNEQRKSQQFSTNVSVQF
ncbi:ShlB/FhaC/HecB family hemolysin secretion/activation protein [Rodentibacter haemolyticus]|uniref:ShlB/FhaC/HecB family hemolysin secretion/activation protein n=1 Tax=Rodentibacter haemolyticus TaxID=2778911 RepID=A0ABX6UUR2_9PAST|nr:ShlB/FhaC/HecB family hemolysin secretion/activation protein [Rodentibacter haemolyticus]QPB41740.1 ShlB/FhaC/HecB family hemolysin secretion/activation protein [Rodentibacter haemolyticus]